MECLFCKIIKKEINSEIIYEDKDIMVFLDINPTTNGDSLIVPKKHLKDLRDINDELLIKMNNIIKKLYVIYQDKLGCDGLTISTNMDYSQEIKHFHIHVIPRYKDNLIKHISNKEILKDLSIIKNQLIN